MDNDDALVLTAYHEAGHAVLLWKHGFQIDQATIEPDEDEEANHSGVVKGKYSLNGYSSEVLDSDEARNLEKNLRIQARISLAGATAEQVYNSELFNSRIRLYRNHYGYDFQLIHTIAETLGYRDEEGIGWIQDRLDETKAILKKEWSRVTALADALLEQKMLPGIVAIKIIENPSP